MILDDLFENNLPPNIKPSDLPPGMRQRLTMKDIEAERPRGAFRYRVGDKSFMDLRAAEEFARGTGEKVQPIGETADEKKGSNPRIERILKMLRAQHPQAEDDLEALILDFRSQQSQDRRDIGTLYSENDTEEEKIERLEKILANLRQQRELAERRDRSPGKITKSEDPCWSGYHMVGTKKKAGREVPNCVPGAKGS
jgi:predicted RNase H-like nuclease (RuvC/YqgF family)